MYLKKKIGSGASFYKNYEGSETNFTKNMTHGIKTSYLIKLIIQTICIFWQVNKNKKCVKKKEKSLKTETWI